MWPSKSRIFSTKNTKRKATPIDEEAVDRSLRRRSFPNHLSELSREQSPGPDRRGHDIERIYLRGSCARALCYLRSLLRTVLSPVREVHIEKGLLIADDDDNRSYVNELWTHLVTNITLRCVSIVVPDDIIALAKKDQGQYE